MGKTFADEYSLLHFAVGIIFRFWNVSFTTSVAIHTLFEILENTEPGIKFINEKFTWWPGGKGYADYNINKVGDTVFFVLGWYVASLIYKPTTEVLRLF